MFEKIVELSGEGVAYLDASFVHLYGNARYCTSLGLEHDVKGLGLGELLGESQLQKVRQQLEHVKEGEERVVRLRGCLARYVPVYDDGERVGWFSYMKEETKEAPEVLEHFFSFSRELLCVARCDGTIVRCNAAWRQLLGYSVHELNACPVFEYVHTEDRARFVKDWKALCRVNETRSFHCQLVGKEGGIHQLSWQARFAPAHELIYAVVRVTDATAVNFTSEVGEQRYATLVSSMAEGVVMHAADGSIIACNKSAQEILGLSEGQLLGRDSVDPRWATVREDGSDFPGEEHPAIRTLRTGVSLDGELMGVKRPDDSLRWISINSRPLYDEDNATIIGAVASFTDVTDTRDGQSQLHQTIQDLLETKASLAAKESILKAVLDAVDDAVITSDVDGKIRVFNKAAERIFGWPSAEVSGRLIDILAPEEVADKHPGFISRYLDTNQARLIGSRRRLDGKHRDGHLFPIQLALSELFVEGERMFTGVIRDLSHEEELERQLRHKQKMEAIGELAGGIAHEFNNILQGILTSTNLLEESEEVQERTKLAEDVEHFVMRGRNLTRQILTFSQRNQERFELFDPNSVFNESIRFLEAALPSNIRIDASGAQGLELRGSGTQLHQVIVNLASNAVDAMPQGGTLFLSLNKATLSKNKANDLQLSPGTYLKLTSRDTGVGIAPSHLERLFEPFFSTKPTGKGSGLGLSIVHGIVKKHGGALEVESQAGKGSTFCIYLPCRVPVSESAPRKKPQGAKFAGQGRILLVDDEEMVLRMLQRTLQHFGYEVDCCRDGRDALARIREAPEHYHAIISDLTMPHMMGDELLRQIRKLREELPFLLISGRSELLEDELHKLPKVRILGKPFGRKQLIGALKELLT